MGPLNPWWGNPTRGLMDPAASFPGLGLLLCSLRVRTDYQCIYSQNISKSIEPIHLVFGWKPPLWPREEIF